MASLAFFSIPADSSGESTRLVRKGLFSTVFLLGGFLFWATHAPLSGAIIAEGIVKIDSNRKTVQHLDGGIVKQILVREGSIVAKNQPLILLDDTIASANLNIVVDHLAALRAKEARLSGEASLQERVVYPTALLRDRSDKTAEILRNEEALFQSKRKVLNDQLALLRNQIIEANAAIAGYSAEARAIEEGVRLAQEQLSASEKLLQRGFIERTRLWTLQTSLAEKRERLGQVQGQLALQRENVAELQLRMINLRNEYAKEADDELKDTKKLVFEQEERYRPALDNQQRQTINAPISGQIMNLRVSTEQGVIKPGEPLMDIVPEKQELILETRVATKDIDSVHLHQVAEIQLSAFNQRTTPMVSGEVIYVSGDALADERTTPTQYYYLAHIRVDKRSLDAISQISLAPGMPVVAFLQTKTRTFSDYILSPLVDRTRRTFKEE